MSTKWYADESAKQFHKMLAGELAAIIDRIAPGYELSHTGINRDFVTEEVIIKLHINPRGRIKVRPGFDGPLLGFEKEKRN